MNNNIEQAAQRAKRYWHIDGLTDIALGGICLLLGVYFYLQATLPRESSLASLLDAGFLLIMVAGSLSVGRLVQWVRTRLTYPRTGFVAYREPSRWQRWIAAGLAMLVGTFLSWLVISVPISFAWMPAATGLVFGAVLLYYGYKMNLLRFYLLAAVSILAGSGLSISGIGNILGLAVVYGVIGLALFLSGGFTLRDYLQKYPRVGEQR